MTVLLGKDKSQIITVATTTPAIDPTRTNSETETAGPPDNICISTVHVNHDISDEAKQQKYVRFRSPDRP